ncbi:MAG: hypothetical protein KZQ86_04580 [Candidatus Thiodiazotropha sp. (ex Lucinoma kastoroae)]|nr:hypothetical protein [Candidatus Thiodiazotropha sp. (ex Lucinoma kastoroae)]
MTKAARERLLLFVAVIPAVCVVILVYLVIPTYISMYSDYQGVLPTQTKVIISYYKFVIILPLLVIAAWFYMRQFKHRTKVCILLGVTGSLAVAVVVEWAVYQPDIIITLIEKSYEKH